MVWVKKPYKSYKGYRWVWKPEPVNQIQIDSTSLGKPQALNNEYAIKKGKRREARQYRNNPKSALYVYTPKGSYFQILNKRVEQVKQKDAIRLLKFLGIEPEQVYADSRFGSKFKLLPKNKSMPERRFGYKRAIHTMPREIPQQIVELAHIQYLKRHAKLVRLQ